MARQNLKDRLRFISNRVAFACSPARCVSLAVATHTTFPGVVVEAEKSHRRNIRACAAQCPRDTNEEPADS